MNTAERKAAQRGGAPVGFIAELDPLEASAVLYLRLWSDGHEAQVRDDFRQSLGAHEGRRAVQSLEQLISVCVQYGRRPIMRHHIECRCLGADEACFANFIASAATGDHQDATLLATLLVRVDMAPSLVDLGKSVGLALHQMCQREMPPVHVPEPLNRTIH